MTLVGSETALHEQLSQNVGGFFYVVVETSDTMNDSGETMNALVARLYRASQQKEVTIDSVRVLRGEHCRTSQDLFREIAAVLQFPLYFGNNWAAMHDCLYDHRTDWLSAALVVTNASEVLVEEKPGQLRAFHEEMTELASEPQVPQEDWRYWTVVYADTREGIKGLRERLSLARQADYWN